MQLSVGWVERLKRPHINTASGSICQQHCLRDRWTETQHTLKEKGNYTET